MKWNWGKGIVVGLSLFMGFILYLVITLSTNNKYSFDLVTEEYYAKEMAYQTEIDAEKNTHNLTSKIMGERTAAGWMLSFPEELKSGMVKGTVTLYRPSNEKLDFELPLSLNESKMLIPANKMIDGRWNIIISFNQNGEEYLYKKSIIY